MDEKSLIQQMIDEGRLTKQGIAEFYEAEIKPFEKGPKHSLYSSFGLRKFDERDLTEGGDAIVDNNTPEIEQKAFYNCDKIKRIKLPRQVTKIGRDAFSLCSELQEVVLSPNIDVIPSGAFSCCSNLRKVVLPRQLKKIESYAFSGCYSLTDINIPKGYVEIEKNAFYRTPIEGKILKEIERNKKQRLAGSGIFELIYSEVEDNMLKKFDSRDLDEQGKWKMPDQITAIGDSAFEGNHKIKEIILSKNLKKIGHRAFLACFNLEKVEIFELEEIGQRAFYNCVSLKSIKIPEGVRYLPWQLFAGCRNLNKVELPSSLMSIQDRAFNFCSAITSINLPQQLEYLSGYAFDGAEDVGEMFRNQILKHGKRLRETSFSHFAVEDIPVNWGKNLD